MKPTVSSLHDWRLDHLGAQERERIAAQELRALRWGLEEEERRRAGPPPLAPSFVGWDVAKMAAEALDRELGGPCPKRGCTGRRPSSCELCPTCQRSRELHLAELRRKS